MVSVSPRTVIYARVSSDRNGRSTSVAQQVAECRSYAESRGLDVVEVLSDNDISAYTGKRRPAYEQLLESLRAGEFDAVLIWEQSRLTRRPMELETYIDVCEPRGVPTYSVTGGELDLTTSTGRMQARIVAAVNRNEVDQLRTRVKRGLQTRADTGEPVGGRRPFGYEDDRVTPRPVEADAVREASESLVKGDSLNGIARRWRDAGLTTTAGGRWTGRKVSRVLTRHRNVGRREHQGKVIRQAAWEPIVDYTTWVQVREVLADPSRRTSKRGNQVAYLGTHLYVCGVCGLPMRTGRGGGGKPRSYLCSVLDRAGTRHPVVPQPLTDEYVADHIVRGMHEQGFVLGDDAGAVAAVSDREERLAELEDKRRSWVRRSLAGLITDADLDEALAQIAAQVAELDSEIDAPAPATTDLAELASGDDVAAALVTWSELPLERKRAIVRDFVRVTILPATSTRQPVYYETTNSQGETVLRSDRIRVELDASDPR